MIDDPTLLRRFAEERREEDFAELVRRYLGLVYRAALRRTNGDTHLAEEIAQQVFATLARDAGSVQRHPVLSGWLYLTTRHAAANAVRSETRRRLREQEAHVMNELTSTDNPGADWERIRPELDRVMDELPERDRHAVLLRYFQNQPFSEIGATLRLSENAARMRVERALERLRELLAKRGVVSTSAALTALLANQAAAAVPNTLAASIAVTALVGGTTVAGTTGFIAFMTTTKMLSITAVAACMVTGVMLYEEREARSIRAANGEELLKNDTARRELSQVQTRVTEVGKRAALANEENEALQKRIDEIMARQKAGANQTAQANRPVQKSSAEWMLTDPEYQRLNLEAWRLDLGRQYAALYRKLGLTAEQIAEFENTLAASWQEGLEAKMALHSQGVAISDPEFTRLSNESLKPIRKAETAKIRQMLGEAGFAEYVAFSNRPSEQTARTLFRNLFYTDTPLTFAQGDKLSELIKANSKNVDSQRQADWETVYQQAQSVLSPTQIAMLKRGVESDRLRQQYREIRNKAAQARP